MDSDQPIQFFSEERYSLLALFADTVLFEYDAVNDSMHFTPNMTELFLAQETDHSSFLASSGLAFVYSCDRDKFRKLLSGGASADEGGIRARLLPHENGTPIWCLIKYRYFRSGRRLVCVVGKITDIDEQKRQEDQLLKLSETDGLTGLRNRFSTQRCIDRILSPKLKGLFFMIDLDNFKSINDSYGHTTGDRALSFAAMCMREVFGPGSIMGRIGGDELVAFVSFPVSRDTEAANAPDGLPASRLSAGLMRLIGDTAVSSLPDLTISIGIARYPEDGADYETLFLAADHAMYHAKQSGKNRYCVYDPALLNPES